MNTLYNLKIIFAYYVTNEFSSIHKWHLINFNNMLSNESMYEYDITIYLLVNDINNEQLINETKNNILSYINNKFYIKFEIIQNNKTYREGIIYKNEIIDKLDKYDQNDLILFLHTKGVSNNINLENFDNTLNWISIMYYFNIIDLHIILDKFYNEDIITYGTLYNYDDSSLTKYKWQYTGSFHWIYPYRLLNYFKENNIEYNEIKNKYKLGNNIRLCAEAFVGDNIETQYVGFLDDHLFNKNCSHFLYENSTLPYYKILYILSEIVHPYHYMAYINDTNKLYDYL